MVPSSAAAPPSGTSEYEAALDKLQPLQPILRGFNHRNRNQHRRAAWWAPFGMLRRHLDKLIDELYEAAASITTTAAAAAAAKKTSDSAKKRKRGDGHGDDTKEKRLEKTVHDHVRWLRDVLVPKCYVAFSQLTADNQFATLGVVLLGALAQVNAVCVQVVGESVGVEETKDLVSTREPDGKGVVAVVRPTNELLNTDTTAPAVRQGGAVVSRDEAARTEKLRRKKMELEKSQSMPLDTAESVKGGQDPGDKPISTEKRSGSSSKSISQEAKSAAAKDGAKPAKKKKKTKKGGDEFDALFNNLF
ncbi:hypothetical protein M426DRAFT_318637 [Hypoxylon sp. CI-4A]|nr:hypothetical protein M426DRAFT_318637 [Hypoxylon sp. CI-4A]